MDINGVATATSALRRLKVVTEKMIDTRVINLRRWNLETTDQYS